MLDIQIENIDESKADLGVRHEYIPQVAFNLAIENEEERVVVDCDHFLPGEMSKYMTTNEDREMAYDLRKVFSKKVKGIRNLRINGKPVTTAEAILKYPSTLELDALVMDVALHIVKGERLSGDERKNLSSASSSSEENTSTKN